MRSKAVSVRLTSVEEVQASVQTFGSRVVALLDEHIASPEEGGTAWSYQQVFDHLDNDLEAVQMGLVTAEDEHVRQLIRVSKLQRDTDRLTSELYGQQVAVRQTFAGLFGSEHGFEVAAISGDTPRSRKDLEEQVDQTIKLLRDPAVEVPELKVRQGIVIDLVGLAEGLEAGKTELGSARSGLLRARKAGAQTLLAKRAAMVELDRVFPAAAGILEGLFRLVGEVDLADRIRTSIRRVTGRRSAEDDEIPAEGASSTDAESAGAVPDGPPSSEPLAAAAPQPAESTPPESAEPASSPA